MTTLVAGILYDLIPCPPGGRCCHNCAFGPNITITSPCRHPDRVNWRCPGRQLTSDGRPASYLRAVPEEVDI